MRRLHRYASAKYASSSLAGTLKKFELAIVGITCVLLGLGIPSPFYLVFWAFFVAIVVLAVSDCEGEINKLRARIAELENKSSASA